MKKLFTASLFLGVLFMLFASFACKKPVEPKKNGDTVEEEEDIGNSADNVTVSFTVSDYEKAEITATPLSGSVAPVKTKRVAKITVSKGTKVKFEVTFLDDRYEIKGWNEGGEVSEDKRTKTLVCSASGVVRLNLEPKPGKAVKLTWEIKNRFDSQGNSRGNLDVRNVATGAVLGYVKDAQGKPKWDDSLTKYEAVVAVGDTIEFSPAPNSAFHKHKVKSWEGIDGASVSAGSVKHEVVEADVEPGINTIIEFERDDDLPLDGVYMGFYYWADTEFLDYAKCGTPYFKTPRDNNWVNGGWPINASNGDMVQVKAEPNQGLEVKAWEAKNELNLTVNATDKNQASFTAVVGTLVKVIMQEKDTSLVHTKMVDQEGKLIEGTKDADGYYAPNKVGVIDARTKNNDGEFVNSCQHAYKTQRNAQIHDDEKLRVNPDRFVVKKDVTEVLLEFKPLDIIWQVEDWTVECCNGSTATIKKDQNNPNKATLKNPKEGDVVTAKIKKVEKVKLSIAGAKITDESKKEWEVPSGIKWILVKEMYQVTSVQFLSGSMPDKWVKDSATGSDLKDSDAFTTATVLYAKEKPTMIKVNFEVLKKVSGQNGRDKWEKAEDTIATIAAKENGTTAITSGSDHSIGKKIIFEVTIKDDEYKVDRWESANENEEQPEGQDPPPPPKPLDTTGKKLKAWAKTNDNGWGRDKYVLNVKCYLRDKKAKLDSIGVYNQQDWSDKTVGEHVTIKITKKSDNSAVKIGDRIPWGTELKLEVTCKDVYKVDGWAQEENFTFENPSDKSKAIYKVKENTDGIWLTVYASKG